MGISDADYDNDATVQYDWIHALTMPRELSFKDGKLLQKPLKEMQQLRKNEFHCALSEFVQWEPKDSCIEIFINDGENVMTTRVYSENLEQKVTFLSKGNVGNVAGYELGSFVIEKHEEK